MQLSGTVRLIPNKSQEEQFVKFCDIARFAYNESLAFRIKKYREENVSMGLQQCIEHIQDLKRTEQYSWINEAPEAVTKQAIKDLFTAYRNFYQGRTKYPKFKKRGKSKMSFYQRTDKFRQTDECHIKMTRISEPVKTSKTVLPEKIYNPRVIFDGKYWFLHYGYEFEEINIPKNNETIGVDVGIKDLAIVSNGTIYPNINKTARVKQLEKQIKRKQRQLSRKYETNKKKGECAKTSNIKKEEENLRLLYRKLRNIRDTYLHEVTKDITTSGADTIVIEDLNVKGMMKNHRLAKAIGSQDLNAFKQRMEYKAQKYGVQLVFADRWYPSSKTCSNCGNIKKSLKLSERTYKCECCGLEIDRDLNASINLSKYLMRCENK